MIYIYLILTLRVGSGPLTQTLTKGIGEGYPSSIEGSTVSIIRRANLYPQETLPQDIFFQSESGFDSLNVNFVGNWPFGPECWAIAYDSAREVAFLSSGGGVICMNVADSSNPIKISDKIL